MKLGDLGMAYKLKKSNATVKERAGTPYHMSPEMCCGNDYGKSADMWALGILLY